MGRNRGAVDFLLHNLQRDHLLHDTRLYVQWVRD